MCHAQDQSPDRDGGVARHFSLLTGWGRSYPETTGYIIPTLLAQAAHWPALSLEARARRMLDWLVAIQFPEGGFQGGVIGSEPKVPVTFNTGQILLGLAAGAEAFGPPYDSAMAKAADWLMATQDDDGCWRRHPTPFAKPGEKTYETHVAWGLLEAARVGENRQWLEAALRQVDWALGHQHANGWMASCCLSDNRRPLTHTLGYALRGIVEAWRHSGEARYLEAGRRLADGLLTALGPDGHLPGRLDRRWRPAVPWSCLTGQVQIAWCWLALYQATDEGRYRDAGLAANRFVRRTLQTGGSPDVVGGVKGAFPVDGDYGTYEYLNWAAKFLVDANQLETDVG
ncbi:MAG: hypothetical protein EA405_11235 [Rhodospirillales bacterium]|nr:MAG: hypothetical protein EA405_11235 [Rhodospirillales bacterium]